MIIIKFNIDMGEVLHWTFLTIQMIIVNMPWWIWVLPIIGIAINIWGVKLSKSRLIYVKNNKFHN